MSNTKVNGTVGPNRWIHSIHPLLNGGGSSQTATAGRVYVSLIEVTVRSVVDRISWTNGATVAGNVRVGIYGPLVTEETCLGASLIVESASTAQAGVNVVQSITISATLEPGRYYIAWQSDDNTATFMRSTGNNYLTGSVQIYDRGGGYGAFTTPCPAVTDDEAVAIQIRLRCVV
jgi:hypothetical protein